MHGARAHQCLSHVGELAFPITADRLGRLDVTKGHGHVGNRPGLELLAAAEFAFDRGPDSRPLSARALMVGLAAAQLLLYVAQENIEAGLAGSQPPGVGAIAGAHWAAPLIHVAVAALLTIIVSCVGRLVRTQEAASRRVEALIKRIVQRLGGGTGPRLPAQQSMTSRAPMPGQRRRAPPARAAA